MSKGDEPADHTAVDIRITGLLMIRSACRHEFPLKFEMKATTSLNTLNQRLIQIDKAREEADYLAEINHNMRMLKIGIGLGVIEGAKVQ